MTGKSARLKSNVGRKMWPVVFLLSIFDLVQF
jgi:hypothetical protein